MDALRRARDEQCMEARFECEHALAAIDTQLRTRLLRLDDASRHPSPALHHAPRSVTERKQAMARDAKLLETLLVKIDAQLQCRSRNRLIDHAADITSMFNEVHTNTTLHGTDIRRSAPHRCPPCRHPSPSSPSTGAMVCVTARLTCFAAAASGPTTSTA